MEAAQQHATVLDTGAEQLGKTYARALIAAAHKEGIAEQIAGELGQLVEGYLSPNDKLRAALASPRVSPAEKVRIIDRLFGEEFHPTLVRFLKVMANRERLAYIADVRRGVDALIDDMMGRVVASVRTAVPINDDLRGQILHGLGTSLGREIRLHEEVDPALIGGMVIRVGDRVFDGSVSNRLTKIKAKAEAGFAAKLMERFDTFITPENH